MTNDVNYNLRPFSENQLGWSSEKSSRNDIHQMGGKSSEELDREQHNQNEKDVCNTRHRCRFPVKGLIPRAKSLEERLNICPFVLKCQWF